MQRPNRPVEGTPAMAAETKPSGFSAPNWAAIAGIVGLLALALAVFVAGFQISDGIGKAVQSLAVRLDDTNIRIDETNKRIDDTNIRIDETNKRIDDTNIRIDGLQHALADIQAALGAISGDLRGLRDAIDKQGERLDRLDAELRPIAGKSLPGRVATVERALREWALLFDPASGRFDEAAAETWRRKYEPFLAERTPTPGNPATPPAAE